MLLGRWCVRVDGLRDKPPVPTAMRARPITVPATDGDSAVRDKMREPNK